LLAEALPQAGVVTAAPGVMRDGWRGQERAKERKAREAGVRSRASNAGQFGALERESQAFMEVAGLDANALLLEVLAVVEEAEGAGWGEHVFV